MNRKPIRMLLLAAVLSLTALACAPRGPNYKKPMADVSDTWQELQDPRLGMVTVTRVKLSADLRHARIFYSSMGTDAERRTIERALEHSAGHIQRLVASRLTTRTAPRIVCGPAV